ncbi:MAG: hypothetical protein QXT80_03315, partial [Thermoplasmatales archaeon]
TCDQPYQNANHYPLTKITGKDQRLQERKWIPAGSLQIYLCQIMTSGIYLAKVTNLESCN